MSFINTYDQNGNLVSSVPIPAVNLTNQTIAQHLTTALATIETVIQNNPAGVTLTAAQTIVILKILAGLIRLDLGLWQQSIGQA